MNCPINECDTPPLAILGLGVSTVDLVALVEHLPAQEGVQRASDIFVNV